MTLATADRTRLLATLDQLAGGVEELYLSGLTTASEATRQVLGVAFQEASRLRLLRLGSTLRAANEELGRFTRNDADFSRRRLNFFLNRSWLLSRGLTRAIKEGDDKEFEKLLWMPASQPVDRLELVTLGIAKKVATGAFCAFDFRMRTIKESGSIPAGQRLAWSCIFPLQPGVEVPPEGFLHLPQKQKFKASLFLEKKTIVVEKAAVALDGGGSRMSLGEQSTVRTDEAFTAWDQFQTWDPAAALERIQKHEPGPFDLDVEMQEEIVLLDWQVEEPKTRPEDGQLVYSLSSGTMRFDAVVSPGVEGKALAGALEDLRKKKRRPPLFGLMHYERCRLILQPLSVFGKDGPEYLTVSDETVDRAALLKALKF